MTVVAADFDAVINGSVVNEVVTTLEVDIKDVFILLVGSEVLAAVLGNFPDATVVFIALGVVVIVLDAFNLETVDVADIDVALEVVTGTGADLRACTGVFGERLDLADGKVGGIGTVFWGGTFLTPVDV